MTGFEYGNARLHFMKSKLLSRKEVEALVDSGSLQGLIALLTRTVYHKSVEAALTRSAGMECVTEALHVELTNTLGKIRSFYAAQPGELIGLVLRAYDIHNLKSILRGVARNVPTSEILATFIPVGDLNYHLLAELANVHDPRAVIDMIVSQRLPFAEPLLQLQSKRGLAETFEVELALDQWYVREALRFLKSNMRGKNYLKDALNTESDVTNLITVMRFAHSPAERGLVRERLASEDLSRLFVGPGHLSFAVLVHAGTQNSLETAITALGATAYEPALRSGLEAHEKTGRLSGIEKNLRHYRQQCLVNLITKDPLGIGVVLGYIALKINEVNNIRWVAQGINLGLKPEAIRAELEFLA